MTTESGRIVTSSSRGRGPYWQFGQFFAQSSLSVGLSVCWHSVTLSPYVRQFLFSACSAGQEGASVLVPQVRTLAGPAGRCCRMKGQDQDQGKDQDRTAQNPTCRRLLAPTGCSAQNGPPTPGPPRIALELPPASVSSATATRQSVTQPRQAQAAQRQQLLIPPPNPEYLSTETNQTKPDTAQWWQPKPARPRLGGHTAQAAPLLQLASRPAIPRTHSPSVPASPSLAQSAHSLPRSAGSCSPLG